MGRAEVREVQRLGGPAEGPQAVWWVLAPGVRQCARRVVGCGTALGTSRGSKCWTSTPGRPQWCHRDCVRTWSCRRAGGHAGRVAPARAAQRPPRVPRPEGSEGPPGSAQGAEAEMKQETAEGEGDGGARGAAPDVVPPSSDYNKPPARGRRPRRPPNRRPSGRRPPKCRPPRAAAPTASSTALPGVSALPSASQPAPAGQSTPRAQTSQGSGSNASSTALPGVSALPSASQPAPAGQSTPARADLPGQWLQRLFNSPPWDPCAAVGLPPRRHRPGRTTHPARAPRAAAPKPLLQPSLGRAARLWGRRVWPQRCWRRVR